MYQLCPGHSSPPLTSVFDCSLWMVNKHLARAEGAAAKPVQGIQDSQSGQLVQQRQQQQQQLTAFDVTMAFQDSVAGQSGRALHKPFSAQGLQLVLAPAAEAVKLYRQASQHNKQAGMSNISKQVINKSNAAMQPSNCTSVLSWILAAYELQLPNAAHVPNWAKNIASNFQQLSNSSSLAQLPVDLLLAVCDELAVISTQQQLQHKASVRQVMHRRTGHATCKEWEQMGGAWVQVYELFCSNTTCSGHMLRRTTNWFEGKEKVHLMGSVCCNQPQVNQYTDFTWSDSFKLPLCLSNLNNIKFERVHVVDDVIIKGDVCGDKSNENEAVGARDGRLQQDLTLSHEVKAVAGVRAVCHGDLAPTTLESVARTMDRRLGGQAVDAFVAEFSNLGCDA